MLRFPLDGLLDEQACYEFLLRILHPDGCTVRAAICSRPLKRPIDDGDQSFLTIAVGSAARSLTSSPARCSGRHAIAVPPSSSCYAGSLEVFLPSIWPTNWRSLAPICSNDGTRYRHLWRRIFPLPHPCPTE